MDLAVVTGSSRGIGRSIADRLGAEGYTVVISSRSEEAVEETIRTLSDRGRRVLGSPADISNSSSVAALAEFAASQGNLKIWINNAGIIGRRGDARSLEDTDWNTVVATNLSGTFFGCREAARRMDEGGAIVNVASIIGVTGVPNRVAYAASKAGVVGLTQSLAAEWARSGIRVNAIAPAYVEGDQGPQPGADFTVEDITNRTPIGRYITRAEVAEGVAFLCQATAITGTVLMVDGGWTADGGWRRGA